MWQPEPGWRRLSGAGPSTSGVWSARRGPVDVVVKRLQAPAAHDPVDYSDPHNPAWWRREADLALSGDLDSTAGLRAPRTVAVEEDVEGITLVVEHVEAVQTSGLFRAAALGRFAGAEVPQRPWAVADQLRYRLGLVARRGGWPVLARTSVADAADHLWQRRESYLAQLDTLPRVPQHGDPTRQNLRGRVGPEDVVAIDWSGYGTGPVGSDLGLLALAERESFAPLLEAHLGALPAGLARREQVVLGARITVVYTALTRADWALARVAGGEGALAGKFRHPSVTPHLLALQRQFDHLEALLA